MEHIDLVDRVIPAPAQTLVVETPKGELILVDTALQPKPGHTVLIGDTFMAYQPGTQPDGVAYCAIRFL